MFDAARERVRDSTVPSYLLLNDRVFGLGHKTGIVFRFYYYYFLLVVFMYIPYEAAGSQA